MTAAATSDRLTVEALREAYARAWEAHDPAAIADLHTEDSVFHVHIGTPAVVGRAAVQAACADLFSTYHDFQATPTRLRLGTDHWVLEWQLTAQMQTAGGPHPISVDCVDVVLLAPAGLVARKDTYLDVAHVNAALATG